jgi:hypothetical protein
MSSYDAGTPLGGERPLRRRLYSPDGILASSPLQEMDGDVDATIPDTPVELYAAARGGAGQEVTLAAISSLMKQELQPVAASMDALQKQFADLSLTVDNRLRAVEARMDTTEVRVAKLECLLSDSHGGGNQAVLGQVRELEKQLKEIHSTAARPVCNERERTAVLTGLDLADGTEAKEWLHDKLWSLWGPQPEEVYLKGDFKGIMFARFESQVDRDKAKKLLKEAGLRAKPDLPVEKRSPKDLLFGLKHILGEWGYKRPNLRVDLEASTLKVGTELVVTVDVDDRSLKLTWGTDWKNWKELHEDTEVVQLIQKCSSLLLPQESGKGKAKGKRKA